MEEITAMTNKSSELCFSKEEFMAPDFSVDKFVSEHRKITSLETLKEDLSLFLKVLQSAMVELINKDYADFVNLSTNLVGLDKSIKNISTPLQEVQIKIMNMRSKLQETLSFLQKVLEERDCIHAKKILLHRVMCVLEGIQCIEKCTIEPLVEGSDSNMPPDLIERIAVQFSQIQFHMSQSKDVSIIKEKQITKDAIAANLMQHMEAIFLKSLRESDEENLYRVLRIYLLLDKISDIENCFRIKIVRPYMRNVINEEIITKEGLGSVYKKILEFIPKNCSIILRITRGGKKDFQVLKVYDFIVNAVWPEIVLCLEYIAPAVFAPGNPELFHKNYTASMHFVNQLERMCVVQASVKRLREHPSYKTFMGKWNLVVYFEIRFQEIGGILENALLLQLEKINEGGNYHLKATIALWEAVNLCWNENVYIDSICYKFWKLSLQLFSRYYHWTKNIVSEEITARKSNHLSLVQLVMLVHDFELVASEVVIFFEKTIAVHLTPATQEIAKAAVMELCDSYTKLIPDIGGIITSRLTDECSLHLKLIADIPRLYRKTNREVPSKPSGYVSIVFTPLDTFLFNSEQLISSEWLTVWSNTIGNNVAKQYLSMTTEVLTSVKKVEDSLKRLKKARDKPQGSTTGTMSDDDKIRRQLQIDIKQFGEEIAKHGIPIDSNINYEKLENLVMSAIKASSPSS